jgi:hypothetical protein
VKNESTTKKVESEKERAYLRFYLKICVCLYKLLRIIKNEEKESNKHDQKYIV